VNLFSLSHPAQRPLPSLNRLRPLLLSSAARPLRFAGTGGLAGATQLILLALMTRHGWNAIAANAVAFLLAAQVNFALSMTFTWRDRFESGSLFRRWLMFHGTIALMALVNMAVFIVARSLVPTLMASAMGIAAGAVGNYLAGDQLVFRKASDSDPSTDDRRYAA
jgi:putative flippase GtrA